MIKKILIIVACSFFSSMQISAVNIIIDSIDVGPETKDITLGVYSPHQDDNYPLIGSCPYEEASGLVRLPVVCGRGSILYIASKEEAFLIFNEGARFVPLQLSATFEGDLPLMLTHEMVLDLPPYTQIDACQRDEVARITISMGSLLARYPLKIEWIDPGRGTENLRLVFFYRKADGSYTSIAKENFNELDELRDVEYEGHLIYMEHNGRAYYIVHEGDKVMRYDLPELLGVTMELQEAIWELPADCTQGLPSQNLLDVVGDGLISTGIVLQRPSFFGLWGKADTEPFLYDDDAARLICF